jgi:hypothetical protein
MDRKLASSFLILLTFASGLLLCGFQRGEQAILTQSGLPAPSFVRGNAASSGSVYTVTLPSVNAGDTIVIGIECSTIAAFSLSGSVQGAFSVARGPDRDSGLNFQDFIYYKTGATASAGTETFTLTGCTGFMRAGVAEYTNMAGASLDGSGNAGTANSGTSMSSGSYAVTAGDLCIGWGIDLTTSVSAGAGWTGRASATIDTNTMFEDQIASGTSCTATATGGSGIWVMSGAAFLP